MEERFFPKRPFRGRGGVHVPHRKNTAEEESIKLPIPAQVVIPMSMHIGAPCKALVKPGERVLVGQCIGDTDAFVSAPIHASVSGTVREIRQVSLPNGASCEGVVIDSDGQMEEYPFTPPEVTDAASLAAAARACGLVGLGGAGFPAYIKLRIPEDKQVDTLLVNAAECEPYLTADYREIMENSWDVMSGIYAVKRFLGIHRVIIGVEENKPEAIRVLREMADNSEADPEDEVRVLKLPARYPQGAEKVLIHACTGRRVPAGKLPADAGCIVINVTSIACLARFLKTGRPLLSKRITVDGGAVLHPCNLIVPIGTPVSEVLRYVGVAEDGAKVLYGGPMMGTAICSPEQVVMKNTNGLLVLPEKEAILPDPTPCIRCGRCIDACPMGLHPVILAKATTRKDLEMLDREGLMQCMECGCCAYVCPAKRPLVQTFRLGKVLLKERKK